MGTMIFQPAARYPADPRAVFVLTLSIFSGLTAFLIQAAPESLEALLPKWAVAIWGTALVLGSTVTLVGMAIQNLNGIIIEQIGSVSVGSAAIFYAGLAIYDIGPSEAVSSGIIAAWGVACLARWVQLQVLINSAHRRQNHLDAIEKLYKDVNDRARHETARRRRDGARP